VGADKFVCLVCSKVVNDKSNARKHVKTHGIGLEPLEVKKAQIRSQGREKET
jgi:hypothetical protein